MNVVERLMKADAKKADEKITKVYKSKALARLLGEKEPVDITIQEVSQKRTCEIMDGIYDSKGNVNLPKTYEANCKLCIAGIIEPSMKDKDLQEHFGCKMAIDLVEKLFKDEANDIAHEIKNISDIDGDEDEIKN